MTDQYEFTCDTCGRYGNTDDGITDAGDDCPADDCDGTVRRVREPEHIGWVAPPIDPDCRCVECIRNR